MAAELLEAGHDTPTLRRLAGEIGVGSSADVEPLVSRMFQEPRVALSDLASGSELDFLKANRSRSDCRYAKRVCNPVRSAESHFVGADPRFWGSIRENDLEAFTVV